MNLPVDLLFSPPLFFFFLPVMLGQGDNALCLSPFCPQPPLIQNNPSPTPRRLPTTTTPLIYFRLQSSSIAAGGKCVCVAKRSSDATAWLSLPGGLRCKDGQRPSWTPECLNNVSWGTRAHPCVYTGPPPVCLPLFL